MKKKTKTKKIKETKETPVRYETLFESIVRESKTGRKGTGAKKEIARAAFKAWMSIPKTFLGMPESLIQKMGITDPDTIELMEVTSILEFSKRACVTENTCHIWKKEFIADASNFDDTKKFFKKLTHNVMGALYREALVQADAPRAKLFMQLVEDWNEQMGIRHSGNVETHLDPEEKAQLDKLLAMNTK